MTIILFMVCFCPCHYLLFVWIAIMQIFGRWCTSFASDWVYEILLFSSFFFSVIFFFLYTWKENENKSVQYSHRVFSILIWFDGCDGYCRGFSVFSWRWLCFLVYVCVCVATPSFCFTQTNYWGMKVICCMILYVRWDLREDLRLCSLFRAKMIFGADHSLLQVILIVIVQF